MKKTHCAAIDLGATSGRVIVGAYSGDSLELHEVHRFPNAFHTLGSHCYWEPGRLFHEIRTGLERAVSTFPDLVSCGVDTWGVDYALLDGDGRLVAPVHAYRDPRTEPILEEIRRKKDERKLYDWTGLPLINYNTAFQLAESVRAFPSLRESVSRVLMLPDYFNFLLSGQMLNEVSIVSTGMLLKNRGMEYCPEIFDYFAIPHHWFEGPVKAGQRLGAVQGIAGLEKVEVVLVPGHDTSCAYEAIPRIGRDLFVSAGTWLLVGGLTENPAEGELAFTLGVNNERDGQGGYRPNKILLGLWLLEQLLQVMEARPKGDEEWGTLIEAAAAEKTPEVLIDMSDHTLFNPSNMKTAIDENLRRQGVGAPKSLAAYTRLIVDSLASSVADTARKFASMTGTDFDNIILVGGGSKNPLFCQRIADYSGLSVSSYKLEGTAVGNIGYQLLGLGVVGSMDTFRDVVRRGIDRRVYAPSGG